jgi:predicted transcriptional regulator
MSALTIRLPDNVMDELDKRAQKLHITRSAYIRKSIETMNKKMQEEEKRTKLIETSTAIPNMAYTPALKLFNATIIPKHT